MVANESRLPRPEIDVIPARAQTYSLCGSPKGPSQGAQFVRRLDLWKARIFRE